MRYHLFICRHAQAQTPAFSQSDFDRELTEQGRTEATKAGQWLQQVFGKPNILLCSSARRTRSTASIIASQVAYNQNDILSLPDFYNAAAPQLLAYLTQIDKQYQAVLLVGHNPGVSELITTLSNTYRGHVPTGRIHYLWFEMADWFELADTPAAGYQTNANAFY